MTMTLKIKIPPVRQPQPPSSLPLLQSPTAEDPMEDEPSSYTKPQRTRKPTKRYSEGRSDIFDSQEPERKVARTYNTEKSRRLSTSAPLSDSEMVPAPAGSELDFADDQREGSDTELPTPRAKSSAKSQPKSTKAKGKVAAAPARKTKRKVVVSDSEDAEDDYMDTTLDVMAEDDEDEAYYSPEEKPVKPSKGETKPTATKTASRGTKRKARAEPSDTGHASTEKKGRATSKKKAKLSKVEELVIDVVGDSAPESSINVDHSSPLTPIQDSPPVSIPKKQKLPTIKKNKLAVSSSVSTPQANPSGTKPPLELGLNNKPNHGEIRKTLINQTDIDLSNKSIYQEIFLKMTGDGATPRRTKEEERRKELNRLRDEAKAKRAEEAQHSFDLQAQYDKISRFEDKLRAERSSALWPNFMGAKWRDEYEREKRRQKEHQSQETAYDNTREEGEVN